MASRGSTPSNRRAGSSGGGWPLSSGNANGNGGGYYNDDSAPPVVQNGRGPGAPNGSLAPNGRAAPNGSGPGGNGQSSSGTGATGVFPVVGGYQPTDSAGPAGGRPQPPRGYAPRPGQGRGRPPIPPPRKRRFINYPRWGRTGWTRWLPSWKLIAALILTGIAMVVIAVMVIYAKVVLPPPDVSVQAQTTVIYYANGKDVIAKLATQDREDVDLAQVPVATRNAVLAAEDHTFYTNSGVDPKSIARAIWSNIRGNSTQGGSTISQQYVKNVYNQRQRTFKRKVTEVFLAVKVNKDINKDTILTRYLNTIYWGRGAYGLQAAAHAYFGPSTNVSKLTVSQSAFLAGIINAPSLSDPRDSATSKARAERRWGVVLDAMVKDGTLSPQDRATQKFPRTIVQVSQTSVSGQNAYLEQMAEQEVELKTHLTKDQIETGGYKIVTTFDKRLVDQAVKSVRTQLPKKRPKGLRIGMATIDPATGAIKSIYGGTSIQTEENQATLDRAEGGSTFKAFGLIAALENGVSLKNTYSSKSPMYFKHYKRPVSNDEPGDHGYMNLIKAFANSVNTVFVQLNVAVGTKKTYQAAIDAGIPKDTPDLGTNLVNVLGSANVRPMDMAGAYGTFASGGLKRTPYGVQSVRYIGTGKSVYQAPKPSTQRIFDADAVADLTYAMQQVVQGGTATSMVKPLGRPVAGKTGTSTGSKSAWFVGFTPQLVTAVAMHEQVQKHGKAVILKIKPFGDVKTIVGGGYPARIWTNFMEAALQGQPVLQFPQPVYGGDVTTTQPPTVAPPTQAPTTPPSSQPTQSPQPTGAPPTTEPTPTTDPTRTRFPIPPTSTGPPPSLDPNQ